jgi:AcrR family transcriptional regulator
LAESVRAQRADSILTRERILDASVALFSERGYGGTSLRAIADAAGVNLAATNYHFGSKAQLLEAAFNHCVAPINKARMQRLAELQAKPNPPGVEAIVRAFVDLRFASGGLPHVQQFVARLFAEPKSLSIPLLERAFGPTVQPFYAALKIALPGVDVGELQWRFHFLIGSMIQLAHFDEPLRVFEEDVFERNQSMSAQARGMGIDQLVKFVVAGICQGAAYGEVS